MKRHRHDGVDVARPTARSIAHERPEHRTELTSPVVLETLNRIRDRAPVLKHGGWVGHLVDDGQARGTEDRKAVTCFVTPGAAEGGHQA
jgi:hypothetical protein